MVRKTLPIKWNSGPIRRRPGSIRPSMRRSSPGSYVVETVVKRGDQETGRDVMTFRREDGVAENFRMPAEPGITRKALVRNQRQVLQPEDARKDSFGDLLFGSRHLRAARRAIFGTCRSSSLARCFSALRNGCYAGDGELYENGDGRSADGLSASATTHCIVISGLGGEPDYDQRFGTWAKELDATLRATPDTQVETLSRPNARARKHPYSV